MAGRIGTGRMGGWLLAAGGVGLFAAGALHPQGSRGAGFHEAMRGMLASPRWPAAHWTALISGFVVAWALWLLVDSGWAADSIVVHAGARLAQIATMFMTVQWAVEIAARREAADYARGGATAVIALVDAMQGAGWPAFGIGFAILALGARASAPRWVAMLGALGAIALGAAGLFAQALHMPRAGVLFLGGQLLPIWMIWAGVRAAIRSRPDGAMYETVTGVQPRRRNR